MGAFSASDAALEGFQVVRTRWRLVLGWCLFSVVSFVGLVILAVIGIAVAALAAQSQDQANLLGAVIGGFVLVALVATRGNREIAPLGSHSSKTPR